MPEHALRADPVTELAEQFAAQVYVADRPSAMVIHLAQGLGAPLLLGGEPGVGRTSVTETLAEVTGARLVRLQCYEGLAAHHALREWDYMRQLLSIRVAEARGQAPAGIFSEEFLLRRPLLEAIWPVDDHPVVMLIDEVDRADEEFEALLLELLSQLQIMIPELGTITAARRPPPNQRPHAQPHPAAERCAAASLPLPPDRLLSAGPRDCERAGTAARLVGPAGAAGMPARRTPAHRRPSQAARRLQDPRSGARPDAAGGALEVEAGLVDETLGVLLKDADDLRLFRDSDAERVYREQGITAQGPDRG